MAMAKTSYYFPEEIWYEIFQRLPSKSLCRFRSVCMSWCRLITSQPFISSHLTQNLNSKINTNIILKINSTPGGSYTYTYCKKDVSFYFHDRTNKHGSYKFFGVPSFLVEPHAKGFMYHKILGSCNGLICLMADEDIILWNPSIEKYVRLPPFSIIPGRRCVFGFGVNMLNGDFKVVRVFMPGKTLPLVEVFSLATRNWKKVEFKGDLNYTCYCYLSRPLVYMNGRAHNWLNKLALDEPALLVSFDMSDEVFREVSMPEQLVKLIPNVNFRDKAKIVTMSLRKECLGVAIEQRESMVIWVMEEYGVVESWRNLYRIDMGLMGIKGLKFVGFMKNGDILVSGKEQEQEQEQGQGNSRKELELMIHDPHSKLTFKLDILGSELYSDKYVESLVLLEHSDAISELQDW